MAPVTTKMSSRGQVVIPERIREQLRLEPGAEFVVIAKDDVLVFQRLSSPSWEQFDSLIREARRQARIVGLTIRDVKRATAKVRSTR
ncbi:MAG TPA: AbrB/MazE/SpoVT family DNA-binding domain-containing protein [Terriglobales bacterium]|nr:AbrB/MazE/SpoVT family DNA-binding domain-containing protein [Terriglobales bacterium]